MAKITIQALKEYFKAGKRPTQNQFNDLLDSYVHLDNPDFVKTIGLGSTREGIVKFFTSTSSTSNIFHIKLPYKVNMHSAMFHIKAIGYHYGGSDIIDITWVGYCYKVNSALLNAKTSVVSSTAITAGQYVGSDSHVYLWFKTAGTYYTTFRIDAMRVGNGTLLQEGDVSVIVSDLTQL